MRVSLPAALLLLATPALGAVPCSATAQDQAAAVDAIRTMYAAATTDDLDKFHSATTKDYYAFDLGVRYDGDAIMDMVKRFHRQGIFMAWNVTQPETHLGCDSGWITYTLRGSATMPNGEKSDLSWLESVAVEKQDGRWRIHFLHSTRVPVTP